MAPKKVETPAVRKSFLVFGGVAVGVAVIGFVVMNLLGGGGGEADLVTPPQGSPAGVVSTPAAGDPAANPAPVSTPAPAPAAPGLNPGGRDPFSPVAASAPTAVLGTTVYNTGPTVTVLNVYADAADVQIDDKVYEGAKPGTVVGGMILESVAGSCASFDREGDRFQVCEGDRVTR